MLELFIVALNRRVSSLLILFWRDVKRTFTREGKITVFSFSLLKLLLIGILMVCSINLETSIKIVASVSLV